MQNIAYHYVEKRLKEIAQVHFLHLHDKSIKINTAQNISENVQITSNN